MSTISASTTSTTAYKVTADTTGNLVLQTGSSPTTAVTIDTSQNMGVGTASPLGKVHASSSSFGGSVSSNANQLIAESSGNAGVTIATGASSLGNIFFADSGDSADGYIQYDQSGRSMRFGTATAEKMRLDASGNLGLGVTPTNNTLGKTLQVGQAGAWVAESGTNRWWLASNWYYNSGDKYINNGYATLYSQQNGAHQWQTAASGTAGNAISFTQAMTLDANGTLSTVSSSSNAANFQYSGAWTSGNANFITMYMPNMSGGTTGLALGRGGGTYNTSKIIFGYAGSNSTSNYLGLGFWDADSRLTIYPTGNASLTGSLTQNTSDDRLKTDFEVIKDALAKVRSLSGFTHAWNALAVELNSADPTIRESGVSAQKVKQVLPEAVCIAPFDQVKGNRFESESGENYLTVMYEKLVPLLIEAIKELEDKVNTLEAKVGV